MCHHSQKIKEAAYSLERPDFNGEADLEKRKDKYSNAWCASDSVGYGSSTCDHERSVQIVA